MRPKQLSIAAYAAANAAAIAASQTPAAGGVQTLTLTSSPYTQDVPRQVSITSAGNDSARTFVVVGTDHNNAEIIEAVRGGNVAAVQTVRAFKTVSAIYVDGNTAAAVTAGTTTVVDTNWFPVDSLRNSFELTLILDPSLAAAHDIDVQITGTRLGWKGANPTPPYSAHVASIFERFFPTLVVADHDTLTNETGVIVVTGNIIVPVTAIRMRSNTVFTGGPITLTVTQTGHGR